MIVADPIGNGLSTSPSNSAAQPGMRFPRFALRDMVEAQHRLLTEHLGIDRLHAVVGASMGGMQALQWAVSHPRLHGAHRRDDADGEDRAVGGARHRDARARACRPTRRGRATASQRRPERGWRAYAGLMSALLMRTPDARRDAAATPTPRIAGSTACVAQQAAIGFDAHDYLYQSWAYERARRRHDAGLRRRHRRRARRIEARALLLAPPLDLFNPAAAARAAAAAIPGARFVEIPSAQGHLAATSQRAEDAAFLDRDDRRISSADAASGSSRASGFCRHADQRAEREHRGRAGEAARAGRRRGRRRSRRALGPTICPAANTIVKAAMPAAHSAAGEVVAHERGRRRDEREEDARRTAAPTRTPRADARSATGSSVADREQRVQDARATRRRESAAAARPRATTTRSTPRPSIA